MSLKIENLTGGYTGVPVIKNINLEIKPGQALGLIGLNGAGKSTTIKHILGLLRPQKGKIILNDVVLTADQQSLNVKLPIFQKLLSFIQS